VLGDFNAQIGRRESEVCVWQEVRELHGIGIRRHGIVRVIETVSCDGIALRNTRQPFMGLPV